MKHNYANNKYILRILKKNGINIPEPKPKKTRLKRKNLVKKGGMKTWMPTYNPLHKNGETKNNTASNADVVRNPIVTSESLDIAHNKNAITTSSCGFIYFDADFKINETLKYYESNGRHIDI